MSLVKDHDKFLKLSQLVNSTFGTSGPGQARVSSQSIKFVLVNEDQMKVNYQALVTVGSPHMQEQQQQVFAKEGSEMIKAAVRKLVEDWKEKFPGENAPKFNVDFTTAQDHMEFVSYNIYVPVRRAMYRLSCLVKIDA